MFSPFIPFSCSLLPSSLIQDIMLKVKNWISEEKKHVRFYNDWNEKEVRTMCVCSQNRGSRVPLVAGTCILEHAHNPVCCLCMQIDVLNKYLFLTSKPMIYLVNLSEKDYIRKKNKWSVGSLS
jgi:obg-like ATPase 1